MVRQSHDGTAACNRLLSLLVRNSLDPPYLAVPVAEPRLALDADLHEIIATDSVQLLVETNFAACTVEANFAQMSQQCRAVVNALASRLGCL
eukprot:COSAG04_NODE_3128_length_3138_cov_1.575189_4_plen_92_part_00